MSTPREMQAGVPQGSVLSPTLYNLHINDTPQTTGVNPALLADGTRLYATECKGGYVLRKTPTRPGVSVGTLKSMKTRLGQSTPSSN
jgi:hypothetical protein